MYFLSQCFFGILVTIVIMLIPGCCWNNCFKKSHLLTTDIQRSATPIIIEEVIVEDNTTLDRSITDSELIVDTDYEDELLIVDPNGQEITENDLIIEDLD